MKKLPIELNTSVYYYDSIVKKNISFHLNQLFYQERKNLSCLYNAWRFKKGLSCLYLYSAKELDIPGFSDNKNICKIDTDLEALKKRIINIEKNNSIEITEESKPCL